MTNAEGYSVPYVDAFLKSASFLYNKTYLFIKGFAAGKNLTYTLKALPLARKVHDGQYRHGTVKVRTLEGNVVEKRLPYVLHVLKVASTLISLSLPLSDEELDLLICVGLLHDVIEDNDGFFKNGGRELVTEYGFPEEPLRGAFRQGRKRIRKVRAGQGEPDKAQDQA